MICNSESDYVGKTNARIGTRSHEHASTDVNSAISKHMQFYNHVVDNSNFKIIARGYNRYKDRKIAEALCIRDLKPELNKQVKSHKLELFN